MAPWQVSFSFFWSPAEYDAWVTFVAANRYSYWKMSLAMESETPADWAVKLIGEVSIKEELVASGDQYKRVEWGGIAYAL
jgi:hypothetical protein